MNSTIWDVFSIRFWFRPALVVALASTLLAGCIVDYDYVPEYGNDVPPDGVEQAKFSHVKIWYATDREPTGSTSPVNFFGGGRGRVSYGTVLVTIPADHQLGEFETPAWWRFEFRDDFKKHIVLRSVTPGSRADFFSSLQVRLASSSERDIFVFVHGFNVSFENAARRTAQLAYDLNIQGAPIFYSWPSAGEPTAYLADTNNAEWAVPHLEEFLSALTEDSGAQTIHLIAHSMGNRPLVRALERMAHSAAPGRSPAFNQIVLTAPDIDAEVFADLAIRILPAGERITFYTSNNDEALKLSKSAAGGYPRAGDTDDGIVIVEGMDTIDASLVDTSLLGHSYYGDNRSVLSDISNLFRTRQGPEARFGLRRANHNGAVYWEMQP